MEKTWSGGFCLSSLNYGGSRMLKAPCLPGLHSKKVSVCVCLSLIHSHTYTMLITEVLVKRLKLMEKG